MTTDLAVYQRIANPVEAAKELGLAIAKSRLLGCESPEQGVVMALECFARGCPPLSLAEEYHIIDGNLSMRADAMLARFIRAGGRHKIIDRTPDLAAVKLTIDGESQVFSLSWEQAQEEGLDKGKKGVKTNYSTPRRRMQMLWARVTSDGVRAMAPQCVAGHYTPEDLGVSSEDIAPPPSETQRDVVDAEYTVADEPQPEAEQVDPNAPGSITDGLRQQLTDLCVKLSITQEQQDKILAKRGCSVVRNLSATQAQEIIDKLAAKLTEQSATEATGQGQAAEKQSAKTGEPCTAQQVKRAKDLLVEFNQIKPGTIDRVKQKLKASNVDKISDLSIASCDLLIQSLTQKKVEAFFEASLKAGIPF